MTHTRRTRRVQRFPRTLVQGSLALAFGLLMAARPTMAQLPDLSTVAPDLQTPPVTDGAPAPGKRVRGVLPTWAGTEVHHALYLPTDWAPQRRFPVIVEYAGNGPYSNAYGDTSTGKVEGSNLGYGITAGKGFLWLCLPYVDSLNKRNQTQWWGDVEATVEYCKEAVRWVCEEWGGNPAAVILCGFSRGAIACSYIGLHDDEIARLWRGMIAYSHFDGVRTWPYPDSDRISALKRLQRLGTRPCFVCQEGGTAGTQAFLKDAGLQAQFTFSTVPFRNHNDSWALRDCSARREVRRWLEEVLAEATPAP